MVGRALAALLVLVAAIGCTKQPAPSPSPSPSSSSPADKFSAVCLDANRRASAPNFTESLHPQLVGRTVVTCLLDGGGKLLEPPLVDRWPSAKEGETAAQMNAPGAPVSDGCSVDDGSLGHLWIYVPHLDTMYRARIVACS